MSMQLLVDPDAFLQFLDADIESAGSYVAKSVRFAGP